MLLLIPLACSNSSDIETVVPRPIDTGSPVDTEDTFVEFVETGDTAVESSGPPWYEEYPCQHPGSDTGYFVPWAMAIGGSFKYDKSTASTSGVSAYLSIYFAEEAYFAAGAPQHLRRLYIEFGPGGVNSTSTVDVEEGWFGFEFPTGTGSHTVVMDDLTEDLPPEWGDAYSQFSEHVSGLAVLPLDPEVGEIVDDYLAPPEVYGGAGFYFNGEFTPTYARTTTFRSIRSDMEARNGTYVVAADPLPDVLIWTDVCGVFQ